MLPFLKSKPAQVAGIVVKIRKPDSDDQDAKEPHKEDNGLEACAHDLINAVHARDVKGVQEALKAAFEICESYPHEEGPHEDEEPA